MDITFGPVQHLEEGDRHDILSNGIKIGVVYPNTGYAYIDEDSLRAEVEKALLERFGKKVEKLEVD